MKRFMATSFVAVIAFLMFGFLPSASAVVASNVTQWCGYGGTDQTGCLPMVEANFPIPSVHSTQLFYDNINAGSYYSTMCLYSAGAIPEVQLSAGTWTAKQRDLCHSIALQVYHDNSLTVAINLAQKVADANSFAGQMSSCQKGIVVGLNPSSWMPGMWRWITCFTQVAFVPKSIGSVIDDTVDSKTKKKIPGLKTLLLSRVPFSYVVAGAVVVKDFVTAYVTHDHPCISNSSHGVVYGHLTLPNTPANIAITIPCTPTGNIASLKGYLADFLWLSTGLGLWAIAQRAVMV